jgi:hypothetical protein
MEVIGAIIIGVVFLAIGYSLLIEFLSKKDVRPVYYIIGGLLLLGLIGLLASGGNN